MENPLLVFFSGAVMLPFYGVCILSTSLISWFALSMACQLKEDFQSHTWINHVAHVVIGFLSILFLGVMFTAALGDRQIFGFYADDLGDGYSLPVKLVIFFIAGLVALVLSFGINRLVLSAFEIWDKSTDRAAHALTGVFLIYVLGGVYSALTGQPWG